MGDHARAPLPLLLLLLAGCAARPTLVPPVPMAPLGTVEVEQLAAVLEAEDRRRIDPSLMEAASTAAHPAVRARVALALGRIGDDVGAPIARSLLEDGDTAVAAAAAFSLGLLRDTASAARLASFVQRDSAIRKPTVAAEAAAALGRIDVAAADSALLAFLANARTDDPRLGTVVEQALIGSWRAGQVPLETFARWVDHPEPAVRWRAVFALARDPESAAGPLFARLLADPEPLVRAGAVRGLALPRGSAAAIPTDSVTTLLTAALEDPVYEVRIEAARSLATVGGARAASSLRALLTSGDAHLATVAAEGLARVASGDAVSIRALAALASEVRASPYVRVTALQSLTALDPAAAEALLGDLARDPSWRVRAAVVDALRRRRAEAVPQLEPLARDPDPRVAARAIEAIVITLGPSAMVGIRPLLLELARSADPAVRLNAFQGLAWLADPATYPDLLDAFELSLDDADPSTAVAGLDAIADLGLAGAVRPERAFFARFREPPNPEVHRRAIVRFGDAALSAWGELPVGSPDRPPPPYAAIVTEWLDGTASDAPRVRIETTRGAFEVRLRTDAAPLTAANFLDLVRSGFYDGVEWGRLVPGFMIQGGAPDGDSTGGPGYTIRDEQNRLRFGRGSIGMALSGPDTAGSQFFVTVSPQPHLDGEFTVFGEVEAGIEVVERLVPGDSIVTIRELSTGGVE